MKTRRMLAAFSLLFAAASGQTPLEDAVRPSVIEVRTSKMKALSDAEMAVLNEAGELAQFVRKPGEDVHVDAVLTLTSLKAKSLKTRTIDYKGSGDRTTKMKFTGAVARLECRIELPGNEVRSWTSRFKSESPSMLFSDEEKLVRKISIKDARARILSRARAAAVRRFNTSRLLAVRNDLAAICSKGTVEEIESLGRTLNASEVWPALADHLAPTLLAELAKKHEEKGRYQALWNLLTRCASRLPKEFPEEEEERKKAIKDARWGLARARSNSDRPLAGLPGTTKVAKAAGSRIELLIVSKSAFKLPMPKLRWHELILKNRISSAAPGKEMWSRLTRKVKEPTLFVLKRHRKGSARKAQWTFDVLAHGPATAENFEEFLIAMMKADQDDPYDSGYVDSLLD